MSTTAHTTDYRLDRWPHQTRVVRDVLAKWQQGVSRVCVTSVVGSGKSLMMRDLIRHHTSRGQRVAIYVHRIQLLLQLMDELDATGIEYGVRAASFETTRSDPRAPVQICSLQTEAGRMGKPGWDGLPDVDAVIFDEYHMVSNPSGISLINGMKNTKGEVLHGHVAMGARVVGFTATPVGIEPITDALVEGASYREMRDIGGHDTVVTYGLEEPDRKLLRAMKKGAGGEWSSNAMAKLFRIPTIFGNILDNWKKLSPAGAPTICYAPNSLAARELVYAWRQAGVPSASITQKGVCICVPNAAGVLEEKEYDLRHETRREILERIVDGSIAVINNRFILRESVNVPELHTAIMATSFGALTSYLQTVGRIQRYHYGEVLMLDHGGNYARHLSPNMHRVWELGNTNQTIAAKIKKQLETTPGADGEPIACAKCHRYRQPRQGLQCPWCGHRQKMNGTVIRQIDGTLKRISGRRVPYRKPKDAGDYFRSALVGAAYTGRSVAQATGYARKLCSDAGIPFIPAECRCPIYTDRDPEWRRPVLEVYPWIRRFVRGGA